MQKLERHEALVSALQCGLNGTPSSPSPLPSSSRDVNGEEERLNSVRGLFRPAEKEHMPISMSKGNKTMSRSLARHGTTEASVKTRGSARVDVVSKGKDNIGRDTAGSAGWRKGFLTSGKSKSIDDTSTRSTSGSVTRTSTTKSVRFHEKFTATAALTADSGPKIQVCPVAFSNTIIERQACATVVPGPLAVGTQRKKMNPKFGP